MTLTARMRTALCVIDVQDPECDVQGLIENREYEFRVAAENRAGIGAFSDVSRPIRTKEPESEFHWHTDPDLTRPHEQYTLTLCSLMADGCLNFVVFKTSKLISVGLISKDY